MPISSKPERASKKWQWILGILGFLVGCEVHVQRAIAGLPATPILMALVGAGLGTALGRFARRDSSAAAARAAGRTVFVGCLPVVFVAGALGTLASVTGLVRWPAERRQTGQSAEEAIRQTKSMSLDYFGRQKGEWIGTIVVVGNLADYEEEKVVQHPQPAGLYVVKHDDLIYSLNPACPHCTGPSWQVDWLNNEYKFKCPHCGSGFKISGIHFEGPATRSLARFAIERSEDGRLLVDRGRSFEKELGQWDDPDSFIKLR